MDAKPNDPTDRDLATVLGAVRRFLGRTLDIRRDAHVEDTIATIHQDMVFQGPNVWVLICSIFIASIGLNTNSTAVIIGAMLISPLMGPILAVGLSVGVNDLPTLRRAMRHFAVMTLVALVTSTLYFLLTPLSEAQSELLARTRPTLLDAAIAFFGGVAGIVGVSRRNRGNVIAGVAIATALMPPLCTAGYGLANGMWAYFLGALYLFALNSIFIAIATLAVVRYLHFPFVEYIDDRARRRVRMRIAAWVVVALIPSTWILAMVVRESIFQRRAAEFVAQNIASLPGVDIVNQRIVYGEEASSIEILVTGDSIPPMLQERLEARLAGAGLGETSLRLYMAGSLGGDLGELRVGIVEDLYERQSVLLGEREQRIRELEGALASLTRDTVPVAQLTREAAVQYPAIEGLSFGRVVEARRAEDDQGLESVALDTVPTVLVRWRAGTGAAQRSRDQARLGEWLKVRLGLDTVRVLGN